MMWQKIHSQAAHKRIAPPLHRVEGRKQLVDRSTRGAWATMLPLIIKGPSSLIDTAVEHSQRWRKAEIDAAITSSLANVDWHGVMERR
jgi:hypothetical protein